MIRTILTTGLAAGVLAASSAWPTAAEEPLGKIPTCVPLDEAAKRLAEGGAVIVEEVTTPYPNHLLIFIHEGSIYAAGVDQKCVYSPSTYLGRVPQKGTPA